MVAVVVIGATIGLTFMFRRFVDRRLWAGMAMPAPWRRGGDIALGLGLGAAMMLAVFAIEYALGWIRITGLKEGFNWTSILAVIAARLLHFISTAVCEETAYRSYLLQNIAERFALWVAVLTTGAVFALSHFAANGFTWGFLVSGVVVSFFLAHLRLLSRAIWLGVGWHLGWDWIEDSAGLIPGYSPLQTERVGPALWAGKGLAIEGGLLIVLVLSGGLALLTFWSWRTGRAVNWNMKLTEDGGRQQAKSSGDRGVA
jgi:hypothetical protein